MYVLRNLKSANMKDAFHRSYWSHWAGCVIISLSQLVKKISLFRNSLSSALSNAKLYYLFVITCPWVGEMYSFTHSGKLYIQLDVNLNSVFSCRHHLQKSVVHRSFGDLVAVVEDSSGELDQTDMRWRPAAKSLCKTAPKYRSILSTATVSTL